MHAALKDFEDRLKAYRSDYRSMRVITAPDGSCHLHIKFIRQRYYNTKFRNASELRDWLNHPLSHEGIP